MDNTRIVSVQPSNACRKCVKVGDDEQFHFIPFFLVLDMLLVV